MEEAWGTLVPLFVGAALTVVGGLVGATVQHRREHERWVRERRYEAYVAFASWAEVSKRIADQYIARATDANGRKSPLPASVREEMVEHQKRRTEVFGPIAILGPESVVDAANAFIATLAASVNEAPNPDAVRQSQSGFLVAMRKTLDINYHATRASKSEPHTAD